jgi:hypothetical protein
MPPSVITLIDNSEPVKKPIQRKTSVVMTNERGIDDDEDRPVNQGFFNVVDAAVDEAFELKQVRIDDDVGGQRGLHLA